MNFDESLRYPDECASCMVDCCSVCGHLPKRQAAVQAYLEGP